MEDEAVFLGQPVAIIGADNVDTLHRARKAAIVEVEKLPPIFGVDEAIAANQFFGTARKMGRGDIEAGLPKPIT